MHRVTHREPRANGDWETAPLLLAAVLGPPFALACTAGAMLLVVQPVFVPRVMLGIGALLNVLSAYATSLVSNSLVASEDGGSQLHATAITTWSKSLAARAARRGGAEDER
jgi:hypothetical protein